MPKLAPKAEKAGAYFTVPTDLERFSSGCAVLDCALGGGWCLGRMENVIGDKSTAKTGLAIEAAANFWRAYPKGHICYRESEHAFDRAYARTMGFPDTARMWEQDYPGRPFATVEDFFEDLEIVLDKAGNQPCFYAVDSLDALSDRAELERKIDDGSYAMTKQKKLGELFRRLNDKIESSRCCLMIVSQVRDNIGVTFGKKYRRNGGKSMDFYATHCLWLSHMKVVEETKHGVERAVAIRVRAKCEKNKAGLPYREAEFLYRLGFGVDDVLASLEWLDEVKRLKPLFGADGKEGVRAVYKNIEAQPAEDYVDTCKALREVVIETWAEVDRDFAPARSKYA